jgi:hypothetical protein
MAVLIRTNASSAPAGARVPARAFPWLIALLWLVYETTVFGAAANEYQVKAVFLYNFAQFVEWPAVAFSDPQAPLVIGVLGTDPFGSLLDETVRGEAIGNRPLLVQRYQRLDEVGHCHILFIGRSELSRLDTIVGTLRSRGVLTVGDIDNFAQRGGMIQFTTENNKIRLRINLGAARNAHLIISSKLLRPAEVIGNGHD